MTVHGLTYYEIQAWVMNNEESLESARHILVQLERMEWLVTSLLKLSKIDAGTIEFKNQSRFQFNHLT